MIERGEKPGQGLLLLQPDKEIRKPASLPERILYTWSDIYQSQLQSGEPFSELHPVISIWMLTENLIPESPAFHHRFQLVDQENQKRLSEHCSVHVLELEKWRYPETLKTEDQW